jgi:hypothetical protein
MYDDTSRKILLRPRSRIWMIARQLEPRLPPQLEPKLSPQPTLRGSTKIAREAYVLRRAA